MMAGGADVGIRDVATKKRKTLREVMVPKEPARFPLVVHAQQTPFPFFKT